MLLRTAAICLALSIMLEGAVAFAQQGQGADAGDAGVKWGPGTAFSSADGQYALRLRGRLLFDNAWIDIGDTAGGRRYEGDVRVARVTLTGQATRQWQFKLDLEFSNGRAELKDGYIEWHGPLTMPLTIKAGQFKTPNSLEEQSSLLYGTFHERASITDAFGIARSKGGSVRWNRPAWMIEVGAFRRASGIAPRGGGRELAGRAVYMPMLGEARLHLGASTRLRTKGDKREALVYRQRPLQRFAPLLVDTGAIGRRDTYLGLEAAALIGRLTVQAEWAWLNARAVDPALGKPGFKGGHADISYFLTDDKRVYDPDRGRFTGPTLNSSLFEGGPGAWQIAARFDLIDLNDGAVAGGRQSTYVLGLNWFPTRLFRISLNYTRSRIRGGFDVALNGVDGRNRVSGVSLRTQLAW